MGFMNYITAFIVIGLFGIALLSFCVNFAIDNNTPESIIDEPGMSNLLTDTESSAREFREDSEETYTSVVNSTLTPGDETTTSGGQFKIVPSNALGVVKNLVRTGYEKIFGVGSGFEIFMTAFFAILTFIMGMLILKAWFGRNP